MSDTLKISLGQHSEAGRKPLNQDFHGAAIPDGSALRLKGIALAVADGISSSPVSHVAAAMAVDSFLTDYYGTAETWSVETAAQRVICATNAWLHAETRRSHCGEDLDSGFVCSFDALVLKARTAHLFHVGDGRILRVAGESLEPLTEDHRIVIGGRSYLGRAMGMAPEIAIDYRTCPIAVGDVFVLCTDGVHEHVADREMVRMVRAAPDLDLAARRIVEAALERGSPDNLTVQVLRIEALPPPDAADVLDSALDLPPAPILEPPCEFEGYRIQRRLHANNRSHIYLATDIASGAQVALKVPAIDLREDAVLLRRFMLEEWIAARIDSPHTLRAAPPARARRHLFAVTEYLDGMTLRQWMHDNPKPDIESVRRILEQVVRGARALHRKEMVHGDLRPENVMIGADGAVKIIDFGSVRAPGVSGLSQAGEPPAGAVQYTAPECLAGEP
ncbi:MAG TPA: protein phosphatase 2C domain-containing protein, partial [Phenylobacterium sp.]